MYVLARILWLLTSSGRVKIIMFDLEVYVGSHLGPRNSILKAPSVSLFRARAICTSSMLHQVADALRTTSQSRTDQRGNRKPDSLQDQG